MYPLELNPLDRSKVVGKCLKWVKIVRRKMTAKIRSFFSPYIPLYQLHVPTPSMAGFSCHFGATLDRCSHYWIFCCEDRLCRHDMLNALPSPWPSQITVIPFENFICTYSFLQIGLIYVSCVDAFCCSILDLNWDQISDSIFSFNFEFVTGLCVLDEGLTDHYLLLPVARLKCFGFITKTLVKIS